MIKLAKISKLASFFKLAAFLALGSESEVESALRSLTSVISNDDLVSLFDLWQEAKDKGDSSSLEDFGDKLLSLYADSLQPSDFDVLSNAVDIIITDAEDGIGAQTSFDEDVESAGKKVDYQPGQEMSQEMGGNVTEGNSAKLERAQALAKRYRDLLKSLKKLPNYTALREAVSRGASESDLGLTKEQKSAIVYDINSEGASVRMRKVREIKRLMGLGLSKDEAEKKYQELQELSDIPEERIQKILDKAREQNPDITEEDVRRKLQEVSQEKVESFKKKTKIPMTGAQRKRLTVNAKKYLQKLLAQQIPENKALQKVKSDFDSLKEKIKYLPVEQKDSEISSFLQDLRQAF